MLSARIEVTSINFKVFGVTNLINGSKIPITDFPHSSAPHHPVLVIPRMRIGSDKYKFVTHRVLTRLAATQETAAQIIHLQFIALKSVINSQRIWTILF